MVFSFKKKKTQEYSCPKCGRKWVGSAGGYDRNNPSKDMESTYNYLAEIEGKKCPFCAKMETRKPSLQNAKDMMDQSKEKTFVLQHPRFALEDVYLMPKAKIQIEEALSKIKNYKKIYLEWNFKSADPDGAGTVLNFYGKPGTGKTLTAEALAGTLGKEMLCLGMSDVESKFMGETAQNIRLAFEFAQKKDAVLFFDEADTLLGARLSNVTQGIDNEVNSLRSTLLIELERFEGIVIFATNFERNYDKAFVSRITQHVCFELPDADGRRHIWDKFLVSGIPLGDERESLLSKLADNSGGFSGRDIRTCMRLALPKAIHRCGDDEIKVSWTDFDSAIQDVRTQNYSVGTEIGRSRQEENRAALKMLGAKISNENSTNK